MGEIYLRLRIPKKNPRAVREALGGLRALFDYDILEIMQRKGLKYIPMIFYTSHFVLDDPSEYEHEYAFLDLPASCFEEMVRLFNSVRQRLNVKIRKTREGVRYALWPSEVLGLKEVQDEINWLAMHEMISKNDPKDRGFAKKSRERSKAAVGNYEKATEDEIDEYIEFMSVAFRELSDFFLKALEVYKKYQKSRFWFYLDYSLL